MFVSFVWNIAGGAEKVNIYLYSKTHNALVLTSPGPVSLQSRGEEEEEILPGETAAQVSVIVA